MAHSGRVAHGIGQREEAAQTVAQQDHLLQPHPLPPLLQGLHKLTLHPLSICREGDASAPGEAGQVQCVEPAVGVQVVQVLVELEDAATKAMQQDQRRLLLLLRLIRLQQDGADDGSWTH